MIAQEDFIWAANVLGCPVAHIKAVCKVEAPRGGFDSENRPVILFEAHKFSKKTGGIYDQSYPGISSRVWNRHLYSGSNAGEHARLGLAVSLDRDAALESASWGAPQILGENYAECGYDSLQDFINAMYRSERSQLEAFVGFIQHDHIKVMALQKGEWSTFARRYNGPRYAENQYHTKLAAAAKAAA